MFVSIFYLFATIAPEIEDFTEGKTYTYMADFVNMLISLTVVVILLIVTLWIIKRIMSSRLTYLNGTSAIRVLEKRILNQKAALYLVEVMGRGILICESSAGIQMLSTVEGEEWEAELAALNAAEDEEKRVGFFKNLLKNHG